MEEYQALRKQHSILEICKTPALAAEVTLQPIDRFRLDAAIIFADILLPLDAMGLGLEFIESKGPVLHHPVRSTRHVDQLPEIDGGTFHYAAEAVRQTRLALADRVPLIGFAGAPFTLASYAIEGGSSRDYFQTKQFMYAQPECWNRLLSKLAKVVVEYLRVQIRAGAQAIQLFDSWVGCLNPGDYEEYVLPHTQWIFDSLKPEGVPLIYFGTGTATLLTRMRKTGCDVIGLDWRVHLDEAWATLGYDVAVQGNLDPVVLAGPIPEIRRRVQDILKRAGGRPGHVFNLGHGILPQIPVKAVEAAIDCVHEFTN